MSKPVIVSGIQPTGNLHIGNYLGAVKNWVELQNSGKYQMYIFIADLHSLTGKLTAAQLREQVKITAVELLAAGINPDKTTLFVQSHIKEHTELAWIFNCVTPMGELERMTQYKDKAGILKASDEVSDIIIGMAEKDKDFFRNIYVMYKNNKLKDFFVEVLKTWEEKKFKKSTAGLLTYPILQAADILIYKGEMVPVGQDQVQHVELTRDIARWFNNKYGECFPEVKHLLTKVPKVMSLLEPEKKMSKSLGLGHVIELCEEPAEIENKLKRAVTATTGGEQAPGVKNLLGLLKEFGSEKVYNEFVVAEKNGDIRYGDLKQKLSEVIGEYFVDFRIKRAKLLKNDRKLNKILSKGAKKASKVAQSTMKEVRAKVGI